MESNATVNYYKDGDFLEILFHGKENSLHFGRYLGNGILTLHDRETEEIIGLKIEGVSSVLKMKIETIEKLLFNYTCMYSSTDDGSAGSSLVDMLTPDGALSIKVGKDEMKALATYLFWGLLEKEKGE